MQGMQIVLRVEDSSLVKCYLFLAANSIFNVAQKVCLGAELVRARNARMIEEVAEYPAVVG